MSFSFLSVCPVKFTQVGCFHDSGIKPRPLPQLLFTDRDKGSNNYSGKPIHWGEWDVYLFDLVCRCAEQAKAKGYNVFGVQHYGKYPCAFSDRDPCGTDRISQLGNILEMRVTADHICVTGFVKTCPQ